MIVKRKRFPFFSKLKKGFLNLQKTLKGLIFPSKEKHPIGEEKEILKTKQFSFFSTLRGGALSPEELKIDKFIKSDPQYNALMKIVPHIVKFYSSFGLDVNDRNWTDCIPVLVTTPPGLIKKFALDNKERTGKCYVGIVLLYNAALNIIYDFDLDTYFASDEVSKKGFAIKDGHVFDVLIGLFDSDKDPHLKVIFEKDLKNNKDSQDFVRHYLKVHRDLFNIAKKFL